MSKVGGGRNYGYGKQLRWAAKNALSDRYGMGHYSTRASHEARWTRFVDFLKAERGIKDARDIDKTTIDAYARHLDQEVQSEAMKVAYAHSGDAQALGGSPDELIKTIRQLRLAGSFRHLVWKRQVNDDGQLLKFASEIQPLLQA